MKKILIVEDDPAILKGLEIALKGENYRVISASDGKKGEQIAQQENIDLIILDWMLPYKNGIEICRDLRHRGISTPIIMLTCRQDESDIIRGLDCGANDYVTKPFKLAELMARIRANLPRFEKSKIKVQNGFVRRLGLGGLYRCSGVGTRFSYHDKCNCKTEPSTIS